MQFLSNSVRIPENTEYVVIFVTYEQPCFDKCFDKPQLSEGVFNDEKTRRTSVKRKEPWPICYHINILC